MIRTLKIRLLPTPEQEQAFWNHIGAARFIYNYMLAEQKLRYEAGEKHMSAFDMNKMLTPLKKQEEYLWLNKVSNRTLQRACADLAEAYSNFFAHRARFPRFKSRKRSKPSFPTKDGVGALWFSQTHVQIQKIGKVAYQTNYDIPLGRECKFSNPRVQFVQASGKWILTVGVERESQAPVLTDKPMGIDVGVKDLAIVAFGDKRFVFHNINKSKRIRTLERKQRHIQRAISRKYRTNGNYEKTRQVQKYERVLRDIQFRLANIRSDYTHKTTHTLVSMLPQTVVMEDLNVSGMMKNRHLAKAIKDQCLYEFICQMQYKCEERGIEFVQVSRFYPSSKTCSSCGAIKRDLKLSERTFVCPECGLRIDRDYNAALNLMRYASTPERLAA